MEKTVDMKLSVINAAGLSRGRRSPLRAWPIVFAAFGVMGCLGGEELAERAPAPESSLAAAGGEEEPTLRDSLGATLAPVSAAIARANARADVDLNLLARVEVQPDEMLEIYEPTPGSILVSGAGAPAGKAILNAEAVSGMAVEDVWNLATHSARMPGELLAALDRAGRRQPLGGKPILQGAAGSPRRASSSALDTAAPERTAAAPALASGWCDTGYYTSGYGDCPSGYDFTACLNNWWNGAYGSYGGAAYVYTNVCPATGPVVLHVQSDHGGGGIWTVSQNTVRYWAQSDWGCVFDCLDIRADVEQASGDRFHFRFLAID